MPARPSISELKAHLNVDAADTPRDAELERMLDAAVEVVQHEFPATVPLFTDAAEHPALHLALVEFVRDIYAGTQSGGGGRRFGGGEPIEPGFTVGRPALPPYVRGLLAPYTLRPAPVWQFPEPARWPGT